MPDDPRPDPYAPPREPSRAESAPLAPDLRFAAYKNERRSIPLLFLLTVVTLGLYPSIWFLRRRRFLDSLDSSIKLGPLAVLPVAIAGLIFAGAFSGAFFRWGRLPNDVFQALNVAVYVALSFRTVGILAGDFRRAGLRGPRFKFLGAGTLFFGVFYLQLKINRAADALRADGPERRYTY